MLFSSLLLSSVKKSAAYYILIPQVLWEKTSVCLLIVSSHFSLGFTKHLKNQRNKTHVEHLSNQQVQPSNVAFYFLFLNYSWVKDVTNHTVVG